MHPLCNLKGFLPSTEREPQMTENFTAPQPVACHVRRCILPPVWRLAVTDDGATVTANTYCATHAAQHVAALPRAGRRITLDAIAEGVAS
mgnify:FL=1